jgi:hypothetical protein
MRALALENLLTPQEKKTSMQLVNETNQAVEYWITCDGGGPDCGTIEVDGLVELPSYDNQSNVVVSFKPQGTNAFSIDIENTGTGQQVELALSAE